MMFLSNVYLQSISKIQCLFQTKKKGFNFEKVSHILNEYEGPTILVLEVTSQSHHKTFHANEDSEDDDFDVDDRAGTYVIGAFSRLRWKDGPEYYGDSDNYLFRLTPNHRNFFPRTTLGSETNYNYLNTTGYG